MKYFFPDLPGENVFGHTKKVRLMRESIERQREVKQRSLRILDVGCGSGRAVTRYLASEIDYVLGIDLYKPNIDYANQNFANETFQFKAMLAEDLMMLGETFDVVVFGDVLEHVEQPGELLKLAVKLLEPKGKVLVSIPNGFGPFEIESAISKLPILGGALLKLVDLFVAFLNKMIFKGAWTKVAADEGVPYNSGSPHIQFFRWKKFKDIAHQVGLRSQTCESLSWLSGPFTNYLFAPSHSFCKWNTKVVKVLPFCLTSSWYFEFSKMEK